MENLEYLLGPEQVITAITPLQMAWTTRNPRDEARDLYRMVTCGNSSIESMRDLIAVPDHIAATLREYVKRCPEDGKRIEGVLQFREKVGDEFERLVEGGQPLAVTPHPHPARVLLSGPGE
jgi:hypothetical protein